MPGQLSKSEYLADKRLPLRLIKRDPQEEYQLHEHDFSELVIVFRGHGEHVIYGEHRTIEAGDVFLIHNRTVHGYANLHDLALYNLMFDPRELANPLQAFCRYPAIGSLLRLEPEVRSGNILRLEKDELAEAMKILRSIETEQERGTEYFPLAMAAHFMLLTVFLGRCIAARSLPPRQNSSAALSELINRLTEHSEKRWTRTEMARALMVSESTLTRMFKQCTGCAPNNRGNRRQKRIFRQQLFLPPVQKTFPDAAAEIPLPPPSMNCPAAEHAPRIGDSASGGQSALEPISCFAIFLLRKNAPAFFAGSRASGPWRDPAAKRWACEARNPPARSGSNRSVTRTFPLEKFESSGRPCIIFLPGLSSNIFLIARAPGIFPRLHTVPAALEASLLVL